MEKLYLCKKNASNKKKVGNDENVWSQINSKRIFIWSATLKMHWYYETFVANIIALSI